MPAARTLPWDWYPGTVPANAIVDETAYIESTHSFRLCRSEAEVGIRIGRGASIYKGTMFDLGPSARVRIGDFVMLNSCRCICNADLEIGDYSMISWNVVLMDSYRMPPDPLERRAIMFRVPTVEPRRLDADIPGRPIRIGRNVWINFDTCVLPGVTIGDGAIVGVRSVVVEDVAPYTMVAGNPARVIRQLDPGEINYDVPQA